MKPRRQQSLPSRAMLQNCKRHTNEMKKEKKIMSVQGNSPSTKCPRKKKIKKSYTKFLNIESKWKHLFSVDFGWSGIRTHVEFPLVSFQDWYLEPLRHPSILESGSWIWTSIFQVMSLTSYRLLNPASLGMAGIEPATNKLKAYCSSIWATYPSEKYHSLLRGTHPMKTRVISFSDNEIWKRKASSRP